MPDLHYTDALLTVIFGGGSAFMAWSFFKIGKMDKRLDIHALKAELGLKKLEKRLSKKIAKANQIGARDVEKKFEQLMKAAGANE